MNRLLEKKDALNLLDEKEDVRNGTKGDLTKEDTTNATDVRNGTKEQEGVPIGRCD